MLPYQMMKIVKQVRRRKGINSENLFNKMKERKRKREREQKAIKKLHQLNHPNYIRLNRFQRLNPS